MIEVNYDYADGGSFVRKFKTVRESRAFCIELMMNDAIVWVEAIRAGKRVFPRNNSRRRSK